MTLEEMQRSVTMLSEMRDCLVRYEGTWKQFNEVKSYAENEWPMMHFDPNAVEEKQRSLINQLGPDRQEIHRRVDEATTLLNHYGLPTIWKVYPPPLIGGLVRTYNIFEAFIALDMDQDARPPIV